MKKVKIADVLYDVVTLTEYNSNPEMYVSYGNRVAVDYGDGLLYPIRSTTDVRPGCYFFGGFSEFISPQASDTASYVNSNVIDFSNAHNLREVIEETTRLKKSESSILTTMNNHTIPEISENDSPAMRAIKQAIVNKHIDLDRYDYRFGIENYPNDKRLLKRDSITLPKLKAYADALDIQITMTLEDNSSDIPNPMGDPITVVLNPKHEGGSCNA